MRGRRRDPPFSGEWSLSLAQEAEDLVSETGLGMWRFCLNSDDVIDV